MVLTASVMTGLVTGCDSARATVSRVVDGDTIDAVVDGREQRIRLLNIDTPETKDPNADVECLGPEASAYLASLLPPGTEIEVMTDEEKVDGWGRVLAGVQLGDGRLVNAEVARAGLALPMQIGDNDRFLPQVEQAHAEAVAARRGLFDQAVACTVPGQVDAVETASATLTSGATAATPAEADSAAAGAAAVVATALALQSRLDSAVPGEAMIWRAAHLLSDRRQWSATVRTVASSARTEVDAATHRARVLRTPPPPPTPPADGGGTGGPEPRPTSGGGGAAPSPARNSAPAPKPKPAPEPKPKPEAGGGTGGGSGPAGYTGPRCYAPGGKTWKPC